jgi:hypothetical protein
MATSIVRRTNHKDPFQNNFRAIAANIRRLREKQKPDRRNKLNLSLLSLIIRITRITKYADAFQHRRTVVLYIWLVILAFITIYWTSQYL